MSTGKISEAQASSLSRVRRRLWRRHDFGRLAPWVVAALLFLSAALLRDVLARKPRYIVACSQGELGGSGHYVHEQPERVLGSKPLLLGRRSWLDPKFARDAIRAIEARPWVRRVVSVRRSYPNGFEFGVMVRHPVGVVRIGAERLLVDEEAIVLESNTPLGLPDLPSIVVLSPRLERVPFDGQAFWQDEVLEATALLATLRAHARHPALRSLQIVELRVGEARVQRASGASDLRLVFDNRVAVLWGRSPRAALAKLDLVPGKKLDHLARVLETFPGLVGVQEVDLRFDEPEVKVPPAPAPR